jgi:hypothetical protein
MQRTNTSGDSTMQKLGRIVEEITAIRESATALTKSNLATIVEIGTVCQTSRTLLQQTAIFINELDKKDAQDKARFVEKTNLVIRAISASLPELMKKYDNTFKSSDNVSLFTDTKKQFEALNEKVKILEVQLAAITNNSPSHQMGNRIQTMLADLKSLNASSIDDILPKYKDFFDHQPLSVAIKTALSDLKSASSNSGIVVSQITAAQKQQPSVASSSSTTFAAKPVAQPQQQQPQPQQPNQASPTKPGSAKRQL